MIELENLILDKFEGILTITVNRVNAMNALNYKTLAELKQVFEEVIDDEDINGIIITGSGQKAFVAGADIKELMSANERNARSLAENGQQVFELIERANKPVIAAINGFALGGGCELAMACHMRIATENARFSQPEVNLGIIPGYGGTQRMTQLVGKGKAFELIMTGEMIDAKEAKSIGLVNHVVETQEALIEKSHSILKKIQQKAPVAIGLAIDSINAVHTNGENGFQTEANSFLICCGTEDFKEGTNAFVEKRTPNFTGK